MLSTVLARIQTLLDPVAKSLNGEPQAARNDSPPRYLWIRRGFTVVSPTSLGRSPHLHGDLLYELEVRCWGSDDDETDRLQLALVEAIRRDVLGRNYQIGRATWAGQHELTRGSQWVVPITLRLGMPSVRLEAGAPDDERTTTTLDQSGADGGVSINKPPGTPGDGELTPGD